MVTLSCANSKWQYHVHKDLLNKKCGAFYAAVVKKLEGSQDGVYRFEKLDDATLARFVEWVHTGRYSWDEEFDKDVPPGSRPEAADMWKDYRKAHTNKASVDHAKVYIFASTHSIADLKVFANNELEKRLIPGGAHLYRSVLGYVTEMCVLALANLKAKDPFLKKLGEMVATDIKFFRTYKPFLEILPQMAEHVIMYLDRKKPETPRK